MTNTQELAVKIAIAATIGAATLAIPWTPEHAEIRTLTLLVIGILIGRHGHNHHTPKNKLEVPKD